MARLRLVQLVGPNTNNTMLGFGGHLLKETAFSILVENPEVGSYRNFSELE